MSANCETSNKEQKFILLSIFLLIFTHSFSHLFGGSGLEAGGGGSPLARKVLLGIYIVSLIFATRDWIGYISVIRRTWLLWVLVVLSIISIFWASLPELTFRRSVALVLTTAYGVYIAERVSLSEMLYLLAKAFAILIAVNLFVIVFFPGYGIHHSIHFGAWRGIFSHKNSFGQMMLFASLVYFTLAFEGGRLQKLYWFGFTVACALVIKSHSQTALMVLCITCGCTPFLRAIRWPGLLSRAFYISGFIFTAFASYIIAIYIEKITAIVGRDATFTGRSDIWRDGLAMIREQPWVGYGFGSEWIRESWGFIPAWHSNLDDTLGLHNGYLELAAQLGLVGVLLYAIVFFYLLICSVLLVERTREMVSYWPLYYLIFLSVYNLFEAIILQQNNFVWIMFVMLFVWLTSPLSSRTVQRCF